MNGAYLNAIADNGNPVTHIGLIDDGGTELTGGSPAYARQPVTWTAGGAGADPDGTIRPDADLPFDVPAGTTVAEWRGFDALTTGNAYGGEALTNEAFANQGTYTLLAAQTAINHTAA